MRSNLSPQSLLMSLFCSLIFYQSIISREIGVNTYCNVTITKTTNFQNGKKFEMKINSARLILEIQETLPERWNYPIFLEIHSYDKTVVKSEYKIPQKYEGLSKNYRDVTLVGFLKNNFFHGMIQFKERSYFIDELSGEESDTLDKVKTRMYRYQGLEYAEERFSNGTVALTHDSNGSVRYECPVLIPKSGWIQRGPKRQIIVKKILHFCSLELIVDPTFYKEFGPGEDKVFLKIYKHIAIADTILRRTDFDDNGAPDGIGLVVRKVTIFKDWHQLPSEYLPNNDGTTVAEDYLKLLAQRRNSVCLVVAFCHRCFTESIVGVAYVPDIGDATQFGGICEKSVMNSDGVVRRMNVAVISTKSSDGYILEDAMTSNTVIHEIGHAFGAIHDDHRCGYGGPYIMHPHTLRGDQSSNVHFSSCSRRQILRVIRQRRHCLETNHTASWCGNGVKEMGEECDCGLEDLCHLLDPCCNPPRANNGNDSRPRGCTYKKHLGYECSYKTDQCCTKSCKIEGEETRRPCQHQHGLCRIPNICDGISQFCHTNKTLNESKCEAVACVESGLETCVCAEDDCKVCCLSDKGCGNLLNGFHAVFLPKGSSCWGGNGACDHKGTCVSTNPTHHTHWTIKYFMPLFSFVVIISLVCAVPFLSRYLNRFRGER